VVHTARGLVYSEPVTDALGLINGVDLAVTYNVPIGNQEVAVSAVTLLRGQLTAADLTEAVTDMPIGLGPDVVCVVPEMTLSATYRPTVSALRAPGSPIRASRLYFDTGSNQYRRLTRGCGPS